MSLVAWALPQSSSTQNQTSGYIHNNLFDALGNYHYCQKYINKVLIIGVRFPHSSHGLARRSSNVSKRSVQEDFFHFGDTNSQPNGRNASSFGAQFYFLCKCTRIGKPQKGEQSSAEKVNRSVISEFNEFKQSTTGKGAWRGLHFNG